MLKRHPATLWKLSLRLLPFRGFHGVWWSFYGLPVLLGTSSAQISFVVDRSAIHRAIYLACPAFSMVFTSSTAAILFTFCLFDPKTAYVHFLNVWYCSLSNSHFHSCCPLHPNSAPQSATVLTIPMYSCLQLPELIPHWEDPIPLSAPRSFLALSIRDFQWWSNSRVSSSILPSHFTLSTSTLFFLFPLPYPPRLKTIVLCLSFSIGRVHFAAI